MATVEPQKTPVRPPDPDPPPHNQPSLYSEKLKVNIVRSERLKRNVLEIQLESDEGVSVNLDKDTISRLITKLGIDMKTQMEGYQVAPRKLYIWCKDSVKLEQFCPEGSIKVTDGIKTGLVKPMDRKEVEVKISGLNLNTPDSLVVEYINKHGLVVNTKVIYDTDKEGPLKGLKNGDRRYLVDFTHGRNMGSYHILDGVNIRVNYSGQRKTCGRCHNTGATCPGGGIARVCEVNHGPRVSLKEHMRKHWEEIKFEPSNFRLDTLEENDMDTFDLPIKENEKFTPQHKGPANMGGLHDKTFTGVVIKNLPAEITETDLLAFLISKGLPETVANPKVKRSDRNTNVDIEGIENEVCEKLIENIHERNFFNRTVYCRGLKDLISPIKDISKFDENKVEKSVPEASSPSMIKADKSASVSPQLSKEQAKAAKKARQLQNKMEKLKPLKSHEKKDNLREDFLKNVTDDSMSEFVFNDSDSSPSPKSTSSKFFTHSPVLESTKSFPTLSSKQIQKEELWKSQISTKSGTKRSSCSPAEDIGRKTRTKSECVIAPEFK